MAAEIAEQDGPEVLEGPGRYKVFQSPAGEWIVARSVPICERCQACGCGEQADPIVVPAMVVQLAMQNGKGRLMGMLKAVTGRG